MRATLRRCGTCASGPYRDYPYPYRDYPYPYRDYPYPYRDYPYPYHDYQYLYHDYQYPHRDYPYPHRAGAARTVCVGLQACARRSGDVSCGAWTCSRASASQRTHNNDRGTETRDTGYEKWQ